MHLQPWLWRAGSCTPLRHPRCMAAWPGCTRGAPFRVSCSSRMRFASDAATAAACVRTASPPLWLVQPGVLQAQQWRPAAASMQGMCVGRLRGGPVHIVQLHAALSAAGGWRAASVGGGVELIALVLACATRQQCSTAVAMPQRCSCALSAQRVTSCPCQVASTHCCAARQA